MSGYVLGQRSEAELVGVHPDLVAVVRRAIVISRQDFGVHDGCRTDVEQRALVVAGASQTMASRHLVGPDGYGNAVDLVPYIRGRLRWEWGPIYPIAEAVRQAARELGVPIRWGGCWDRLLTDETTPAAVLVEEYAARRRAAGKRVFIDGPHFELPKSERYP